MKTKITKILLSLCFVFAMFFGFIESTNVITSFASSTSCIENGCSGTYVNGICTESGEQQYHFQPAEYSNDDGYYEISNAGQLIWFSNQVNSGNRAYNAILTADIDFEGIVLSPINFRPIGTNYSYTGIFDGNEHTISNFLYTSSSGDTYVGLFGSISEGGIKNLTVQGNILANGTVTQYVGLIAGQIKDSGLYNCKAIGTVKCINTSGSNTTYLYVGGMLGVANHSVVINCGAMVDVYQSNTQTVGLVHVGGLVGTATVAPNAPTCLLNCYSIGNISASGSVFTSSSQPHNYSVGGIAGYLCDDAVNNYFYGTVTSSQNKNLGYAFGYVEPTFSATTNGVTTSGSIIVANNYYVSGNTAIGAVSTTTNTSSWATALAEEKFRDVSGAEDTLLSLLNNNLEYVESVIVAHRAILNDSTWADIVKEMKGETFTVFNWAINPETGLPQTTHHIYDDCLDTTCNDCGEIRIAPGHTFDNCFDTTCNICGAIRVAQNHTYDDCADEYCNNCGEKRTAPGHYYYSCSHTTCNDCGHVREPIAHTYESCTSYECLVCGYIRENAEHSLVHDEAVAPTCTSTGLSEGYHCSACNEIIIKQETIPILNHDFSGSYEYDERYHWHNCGRDGCLGVDDKIKHQDKDEDNLCDYCLSTIDKTLLEDSNFGPKNALKITTKHILLFIGIPVITIITCGIIIISVNKKKK